MALHNMAGDTVNLDIFLCAQDLYYPDRNQNNGEEIRLAYCLHALNHVLK